MVQAFSLSGRSPLLLRMAALRARKWKHSDAVPRLAEDISSMVDSYFHWLSHESLAWASLSANDFGSYRRKPLRYCRGRTAGYPFAGPGGAPEYADSNPFAPDIGRLPDIVWSRLYAELKPFLAFSDARRAL